MIDLSGLLTRLLGLQYIVGLSFVFVYVNCEVMRNVIT